MQNFGSKLQASPRVLITQNKIFEPMLHLKALHWTDAFQNFCFSGHCLDDSSFHWLKRKNMFCQLADWGKDFNATFIIVARCLLDRVKEIVRKTHFFKHELFKLFKAWNNSFRYINSISSKTSGKNLVKFRLNNNFNCHLLQMRSTLKSAITYTPLTGCCRSF